MRSKYLLHSALLFLFLSLLFGCAGSFEHNQLSFGIEAAKENLWDEAVFRWKKVVRENPESVAAHNNLAIAYEKKGLYEEAKKEYERALEIQPNNKYVQLNYKSFLSRHEELEGDKGEDDEKD